MLKHTNIKPILEMWKQRQRRCELGVGARQRPRADPGSRALGVVGAALDAPQPPPRPVETQRAPAGAEGSPVRCGRAAVDFHMK